MNATVDPPETVAARHALVQALVTGGAIGDPAWESAFEQVPRHVFVPVFYTPGPDGYERVDSARPEQRETWLSAVYSDIHLVTQVTEGAVTSSATQPSLMVRMLHALDLEDGMRVLEIGTGTGYNAALLRHRAGPNTVTSIDLALETTDPARAALAVAGYCDITLLTGDGSVGHAVGGPYDRIIATCRISHIPQEWLQQLTPTGRILAPYGNGLLDLRPEKAGTASGRFLATPAAFMPLRQPDAPGIIQRPELPTATSEPKPLSDAELRDPSFRFLTSIALPGLVWQYDTDTTGTITAACVWRRDQSIACADLTKGSVAQHGPARLWDRLHALHAWYESRNHPDRTRYGITVTETAQQLWLDQPDSPVPGWPNTSCSATRT